MKCHLKNKMSSSDSEDMSNWPPSAINRFIKVKRNEETTDPSQFIPSLIEQHGLNYQIVDTITNFESDDYALKKAVEQVGIKTAKALFQFDSPKEDPPYEGDKILKAMLSTYSELTHDLCHYKLAAPSCRLKYNFGLGKIGSGDGSIIDKSLNEEAYVCALDAMVWLWYSNDYYQIQSKISCICDYDYFKTVGWLCKQLERTKYLNEHWQPTSKLNSFEDIDALDRPISWTVEKLGTIT